MWRLVKRWMIVIRTNDTMSIPFNVVDVVVSSTCVSVNVKMTWSARRNKLTITLSGWSKALLIEGMLLLVLTSVWVRLSVMMVTWLLIRLMTKSRVRSVVDHRKGRLEGAAAP